ncbi:MAG: hypothetical protein IPP74_14360 [Alphaproteobacteria bacterium]|nr:hypothetical protein [Alphaproteobacteria bacterium]
MKTIEIKLNDADYIIQGLNAHDASYLAVQFMPILLSLQSAITSDSTTAIAGALSGLTKDKYNEIVFSLFSLIKKREHNVLCDIFKNGVFMYEDVKNDPYLYMSLLGQSFMLSFGDFLDSAARAFPSAAAALNIQSNTQA